ncbi:SRR1-like protein [Salarias fasciatus]|uniref:SRR1-like protein n=1 Tax=Salarias fasciatus TaxID=181472 RepID=UPI001176712F|nr:SRR1-like protein [Salarias fasciatus]
MSGTGDEWQVARRRKGATKKSKSPQVSSALNFCQEHLDINKTVKRIKDTVIELRCEDFWLEWKKELLAASSSASKPWEQLEECVCYGLGSFSSCVSARFQLALLLLLLEAGQIALKDCSVYDPAFSSAERDVLRELGLTVLTENEEGKRVASKPTLFYLMHCGKALYNNLLWKNWSTQCLSMVIIIGNSFSGIRERTIDRELQRDYGYISKAVNFCEERRLPCPARLIDVFSDTSVISFPSCSLQGLPQSTWTDPPEPQYQHCSDLEIILKETQTACSQLIN